MKGFCAVTVCMLLGLALGACGPVQGSGEEGLSRVLPVKEVPYRGPVTGKIAGLVTDVPRYVQQDGRMVREADPLEGVRVYTRFGNETVTSADGMFLLEGVTPRERIVVFFEKEDHTVNSYPVRVEGWETATANAVLKPREVFEVPVIELGATLRASTGAVLTLPPMALVDKNGYPISGRVTVGFTPVDPTDRGDMEVTPGDMTAVDDRAGDGSSVALLRSYGMFEVSFSQFDQPLKLSPGMSARLEVPLARALPGDQPDGAGTVTPLWLFDNRSGRWVRQGGVVADGTRGEGGFVGEITPMSMTTTDDDYDDDFDTGTDFPIDDDDPDMGDFDPGDDRYLPNEDDAWSSRWWNIDVYGDPTCIQGVVVDAVSNPLPGANVGVWVPSDSSHTRMLTSFDGHFLLYPTVANTTNNIIASIVTGKQIYYSEELAIDTGSTSPHPDVCEWVPRRDDRQSTIEIPVCFLAGRVSLFYNRLVTRAGAVHETTAGHASFHEALGRMDWCKDSLYADVDEACMVIDAADLDPEIVDPEELTRYGAGARVTLSALEGERSYDLFRQSFEDGIRYSTEGISMFGEEPIFNMGYSIYAPGQRGGLPEFEANSPLVMPAYVQARGILAGIDPQVDASRSLQLGWEPSSTTPKIYFMLLPSTLSEQHRSLFCRMRDDGAFTVPADLLSRLPRGEASLILWRTFDDYFRLPTGKAARSSGTARLSVMGTLR